MRSLSIGLPFALAASAISAQTLVLPDNHNFMESPNYTTNTGDTNYWTTGARRFQILYEASHFTGKAGIQPGGVLITRLQFRGEDGETNIGGQVYANVSVEVGATSLTSGTMSTNFANNRSAATMGTLGTVPSLTVGASTGACPNSYIVDIDLLAIGAQFVFDPHSAQPNLLIDITIPAAPTQVPPQSMIGIQDTTAHGAGIRGRSVYTSTITNPTGTNDTTPPIVGIEFAGPGGWPTQMPARAEFVGAGCGGAHSTIYQAFSQDQAFDLGAGLTFIPDTYPSPNTYTVINGAPPIDLTQLDPIADTSGLDSSVVHPLGFQVTPFHYPGGSTSTVVPTTNGYVWLDSAMTDDAQYNPTKTKLLGNTAATPYTARFMPYWTDHYPSRNLSLNPQAGLHVRTVPESAPGAGDAVCYMTWFDSGVWRATAAGQASNTYQVVMHEQTGIVEFRYGVMMPYFSTLWTSSQEHVIIGFTRGRIAGGNSLDPQSRDLSHELPFTTSVEGTTSNVSLTGYATPVAGTVHQTARMFGGQTMTWNIDNIPAGTVIAWTLLDVGISQPGLPLGLLGFSPPGCILNVSPNPIMLPFEQFFLPGSSVTGSATLVVPHGWEGITISAQAVGIDVFGGPHLTPWTSNTIQYTVGLD